MLSTTTRIGREYSIPAGGALLNFLLLRDDAGTIVAMAPLYITVATSLFGKLRLARLVGEATITLTYPDTICTLRSLDSIEAGAPANEIEITSEMIEAGALVLCGFETETADETYWAEKTYIAMREAAPHHKRESIV
jgi:hypothetical protein